MEDALCVRSRRREIGPGFYGLLHTPAGSPLLATANKPEDVQRLPDSSTKVMSRVHKREIVVRDGNKCIWLQHGACSFQDRP